MNLMNLTQLIQHLRQLEEKASPKDWHFGWCSEDTDTVEIDDPNLNIVCSVHDRKNQAFICQMRNASPTLLKALESAIEVIRYCADDITYLDDDGPGSTTISGNDKARTWLRENGISDNLRQ